MYSHRSIVFTLSRIDSPVVGWGHERAASSANCEASSPCSGGTVNSGATIPNRNRAHLRRAGISTSFGIGVFLPSTLAAASVPRLCHLLRDLFPHRLTQR